MVVGRGGGVKDVREEKGRRHTYRVLLHLHFPVCVFSYSTCVPFPLTSSSFSSSLKFSSRRLSFHLHFTPMIKCGLSCRLPHSPSSSRFLSPYFIFRCYFSCPLSLFLSVFLCLSVSPAFSVCLSLIPFLEYLYFYSSSFLFSLLPFIIHASLLSRHLLHIPAVFSFIVCFIFLSSSHSTSSFSFSFFLLRACSPNYPTQPNLI